VTAATAPVYGFIGLGQMGGPMAANLSASRAKNGAAIVAFDKAGTEGRAPPGAERATSVDDVARRADAVFLSLPDGPVVKAVVDAIAAADGRRVATVIDLSTVGIEAARAAAGRCTAAGMTYVDCPVSGGRAGAIAATIAVMWAGPADLLDAHRPALAAIAKNVFHVGDRPGQGQAMKLLNNFLSATATAATGEAMLFGLSQGLDLETMLAVVNVSTGESRASREKFPARVLTGSFDSGFATALMAKDVTLYAESVAAAGTPADQAKLTADLWRRADAALPGSDHMEIYKYQRDGAG
jgi:3-hydroxyisobutyrate dehydrogenase